MKDLKSPTLIKLKAILFFVAALIASVLVINEHPTLKVATLLVLAIWCFCRSYYFVFYVIEHYVDPGYRFSGLGSFARYVFSVRKAK